MKCLAAAKAAVGDIAGAQRDMVLAGVQADLGRSQAALVLLGMGDFENARKFHERITDGNVSASVLTQEFLVLIGDGSAVLPRPDDRETGVVANPTARISREENEGSAVEALREWHANF